MVKYNYDAWGSITSITGTLADTIGVYNSFRYKGYYYDTESRMYYCKSRYYVPEWCRWLNADNPTFLEPMNLDGMNLFAYCQNNPVMLKDENGNFTATVLWVIGVIASTVVSLVSEFIEDLSDDKKINKKGREYVGATFGGLIGGMGPGFVGGFTLGFIGSMLDGCISGDMNDENFLEYIISSGVSNFLVSGIGTGTEKLVLRNKAKSFTNIKGKVANSKINKVLRPITDNLNIGSNKATIKGISNAIDSAEVWTKHKMDGIVASNVTSFIISLF